MRLKIISDGHRTRVVNPDTGEDIDGVIEVAWRHERGSGATPLKPVAVITVRGVEAELMVQPDVVAKGN